MTNTIKSQKESLIGFHDVKRYLKISRATLYKLLQERRIPAYKVGGQWRFRKEKLNSWLDENENMGGQDER